MMEINSDWIQCAWINLNFEEQGCEGATLSELIGTPAKQLSQLIASPWSSDFESLSIGEFQCKKIINQIIPK